MRGPLVRALVCVLPLGLIAWGMVMLYWPATPLVLGGILWLEVRRLWSVKS